MLGYRKKNTMGKRQFNLTIDDGLWEKAKAAAKARGVVLSDWITEAIRDKLLGVPGKLSGEDQGRVERYIALLRRAGNDAELKAAIDGNFALFERALSGKLEL